MFLTHRLTRQIPHNLSPYVFDLLFNHRVSKLYGTQPATSANP